MIALKSKVNVFGREIEKECSFFFVYLDKNIQHWLKDCLHFIQLQDVACHWILNKDKHKFFGGKH